VSIDSSDWDIGTTGDMSGIGAITANGAVDFQSTLDVDGAMTCTNVTVDSGATVTLTGVTVTNGTLTGVTITASTITNATYGGSQSFTAGTITGGTITNATAVWASSFGIPGFAGYTGVVTNTAPADAATNVMFYCGGIVTNVVKTP